MVYNSIIEDSELFISICYQRVHQLDFIGEFIQANVKHSVFTNLESRYGEYFPDYAKYFGRPSRLNISIYVMTNYVKLLADKLINRMIYEACVNQ